MNIGPKSGRWLRSVGIATYGDLFEAGAIAAFDRIRREVGIDHLMLLYALQGAIDGRNLLDLPERRKRELRLAVGRDGD